MSSSLLNRIAQQGSTKLNLVHNPAKMVQAQGSDHTSLGLGEPGAVNASGMPYPDQTNESTYDQPKITPLVRIGIHDGVLSYEDGPIVDPAAGGPLIIPQTAPGQWAQLYRAGRLYGR